MPLSKKAEGFIRRHVKKHINEMKMGQKQAVAVAYHEARDKGYKVPKKPLRKHLS